MPSRYRQIQKFSPRGEHPPGAAESSLAARPRPSGRGLFPPLLMCIREDISLCVLCYPEVRVEGGETSK